MHQCGPDSLTDIFMEDLCKRLLLYWLVPLILEISGIKDIIMLIGNEKNYTTSQQSVSLYVPINIFPKYFTDSGYVSLEQGDSILNATHCTFASNNATYGGAILAQVGWKMDGLAFI